MELRNPHSRSQLFLAAADDKKKREWINALHENIGKEPVTPPERFIKGKKRMTGQRMVKAALVTPAGIKILKEFVGEDTLSILDAVKKFVQKYDTQEKGIELEKQIFKIGLQATLLYRNKKLSIEIFPDIVISIHNLCSKLIDGYEIPFTFEPTGIINAFRELERLLNNILKPHLPEKEIQKNVVLFDYLCGDEILREFFMKNKHQETRTVCLKLRKMWDAKLV